MSQSEPNLQPLINTQAAGVEQRPMSTYGRHKPNQSKAWIVGVILGLFVIAVLVWFFVIKEDDTPVKAAAAGGCKDGEEMVGEKCLVKCADGQVRVGEKCLVECADGQVRVGGVCGCADGEEMVGTKCLVKCTDGQMRVGEVCKERTKPHDYDTINIGPDVYGCPMQTFKKIKDGVWKGDKNRHLVWHDKKLLCQIKDTASPRGGGWFYRFEPDSSELIYKP